MRQPIFGWMFVAVALLLGGCWHQAKEFQEMPDFAAVGEMAPESHEAMARNRAILEKIARAPMPDYRLEGGDIFSVRVFDHPELEMPDVLITPDGNLTIPMIGPVKVGGLTIKEAAKVVEAELTKYIKNPNVVLCPRQINSTLATVAGKVSRAGRFPVTTKTRLADLIALGEGFPNALADGMTIELADLNASVFVRDGKALPIDFVKAISGDPLHNILVRGGDYVYIAARSDKLIAVLGAVKSPRYVTWYESIGVLEAVAKAQGLSDDRWQYALVIRGSVSDPRIYRADLDEILAGKRLNPRLQPGDVLYIPKDNISEYNVFVKKLWPTAQFINMLLTPGSFLIGSGLF